MNKFQVGDRVGHRDSLDHIFEILEIREAARPDCPPLYKCKCVAGGDKRKRYTYHEDDLQPVESTLTQDSSRSESAAPPVRRLSKRQVAKAIRAWCKANEVEWGDAILLDRAEWDERKQGESLGFSSADFILCTDGSELYDIPRSDELLPSFEARLDRLGLVWDLIDYAHIRLDWSDTWKPFAIGLDFPPTS